MMRDFIPFPVLYTQRLKLRETIDSDLEEIFFLRSDANVNKYIDRPVPKTIKDVEEFVSKVNEGTKNGDNVNWNIVLKDNPFKMIGSICLWNFSKDRKVAEVGYALHPEFQNKGIMSEAMRCVLNFGFDKLHLHIIEAYTHRDNLTSKQLLLKNNFSLVQGKIDEGFPDNLVFEIKKELYNCT